MRNVLLLVSMMVLSVGFMMPQVGFARLIGDNADAVQSGSDAEASQYGGASEGAQSGGEIQVKASLKNPLDGGGIGTIPEFFLAIINILMIFAVPFIVFFIIYAGFLYVSARGNAETIKKAHAALLYALIGGLLILGSRTILTIITETAKQIT